MIACECGMSHLQLTTVVYMSLVKNGVLVKDGKSFPDGSVSVRDADLYECPECNRRALMGFGQPYHLSTEKFERVKSEGKLMVFELSEEA